MVLISRKLGLCIFHFIRAQLAPPIDCWGITNGALELPVAAEAAAGLFDMDRSFELIEPASLACFGSVSNRATRAGPVGRGLQQVRRSGSCIRTIRIARSPLSGSNAGRVGEPVRRARSSRVLPTDPAQARAATKRVKTRPADTARVHAVVVCFGRGALSSSPGRGGSDAAIRWRSRTAK